MPQCHLVTVAVGLTIVAFSLAFTPSEGAFINLKVYENDWLKKILTEPLNNNNIRPTIMNTSEPIEISVSLVVHHFDAINDKKQEYSIQVTIRQEWEDDRLAYAKFNPVQLRQIKFLTLYDTTRIWIPDTIFKNEKLGHFHNMIKPNMFARIFANGTVIMDTRITLTLSCPMNLRYFPYDRTTCNIKLASYAFARDDLIYKWKPIPSPIRVESGSLFPPEYIFDSVTSNYCDAQSGIGVYSCLLGEFHLHRGSSFYLKQAFIPLTNSVIVAWFSFLLDYRSDRTLLFRGVICLAALSMGFSKLSSIGQMLPRTRYTTAMDVWTGISITFVFVALAELMVVHYLWTNRIGGSGSGDEAAPSAKSSKRGSTFGDEMEMTPRTKIEGGGVGGGSALVDIEHENVEVAERKKSVEVQTVHWTNKVAPEKIEKWTKLLYPPVFAGFNVIFWLVCSNSGDH